AELLPDLEARSDEEIAAEVDQAVTVVTLAQSVWREVPPLPERQRRKRARPAGRRVWARVETQLPRRHLGGARPGLPSGRARAPRVARRRNATVGPPGKPHGRSEWLVASRRDVTGSTVRTRHWHRVDDGRVQCDVCPRGCRMREGQRGMCFVRACEGG